MVRVVSTYAFYCFYFNIMRERESPGHAAAKGKNPSSAYSGALMLPHDLATPFVRPRSYKSGGKGTSGRSPSSATTPITGET